MAIQNAKSQVVTDLDASPVVKTNQLENGGVVRESFGTIALTATQVGGDAGSVWRFSRIPARARVTEVLVANDDLDGATPTLAFDLGLYEVNDGAVKDADFFASASTQLQAAAGYTDLTYESAVVDLPNRGKAVWEQLGDTDNADNRGKEYDLAMTITTAATNAQAGDIIVKVKYVLFD